MSKVEACYTDYFKETLRAMTTDGLLLVSVDSKGKPNVMTIGWGSIGLIWGKPMFVVLVRPSRFTYGLIEQTGDFTVNVPPKGLAETVAYCGSVSGRDHDKFAEKGLTAIPAKRVKSPIIEQCVIHYECKVVHKNDVIPAELASEIPGEYYPEDNYHRIFFGEILSVYASSDARERI